MATYLGLHLATTPILMVLLYGQAQPWGSKSLFSIYFFGYFGVYIASAILLLFISLEIFRTALVAFPGLLRIGLIIFRWAILVSVIVTLSSVSFLHRGIMLIPDIAYALMRSVSVLELCLLAFLCLSMNALRLSVRDLPFGLALGFGVMAASEFILASLISSHTSMTTPLQFAYEGLILVALSVWIAYSALPQPSQVPVVMPASSAIQRWNEIASALGHTGTQVAVQQPSNGFFLTDVEKVVEKVLNRNLKGRESEL
ncbi:MAG: hypothetical protein ACLGPM_00745 [Acidobacteriota bacterium]